MEKRNDKISMEELYRAFDPSYAEQAWRNKENGGESRDDTRPSNPTRPAIGSSNRTSAPKRSRI